MDFEEFFGDYLLSNQKQESDKYDHKYLKQAKLEQEGTTYFEKYLDGDNFEVSAIKAINYFEMPGLLRKA